MHDAWCRRRLAHVGQAVEAVIPVTSAAVAADAAAVGVAVVAAGVGRQEKAAGAAAGTRGAIERPWP